MILGGLYAWIAGAMTHEEVSLKTGVIVVIIPSVVLVVLALAETDIGLSALALMFGLLAVGGRSIAKLRWKPSLILAAIFTVLTVLLTILLYIAIS